MNRRALAAAVLLSLLWMLGSGWSHLASHLATRGQSPAGIALERAAVQDTADTCPACNLLHNAVTGGVLAHGAQRAVEPSESSACICHALPTAVRIRCGPARAPPSLAG